MAEARTIRVEMLAVLAVGQKRRTKPSAGMSARPRKRPCRRGQRTGAPGQQETPAPQKNKHQGDPITRSRGVQRAANLRVQRPFGRAS